MAYDNTNSGMLAKNERQREGKKDPTHTGFINVDGKEYWLKAWVKQGKEGSKMEGKSFFSLSIDPKDDDRDDNRGSRNRGGNDRGGNDRGSRNNRDRDRDDDRGNRGSNNGNNRGGFDDMDDDIPF